MFEYGFGVINDIQDGRQNGYPFLLQGIMQGPLLE